MADPFMRDDASFDASLKAEDVLDRVLDDTSELANEERSRQVAVAEELKKKRLLEEASNRIKSRILFITNDNAVTEKGTTLNSSIVALTEVFDEIHIIVLGRSGQQTRQTIRLEQKVWAYPTAARFFFRQSAIAESIARNQLEFTDGFRPDIIVALDPFESGLAAMKIAHHFERPWQIHILGDNFLNEKKFIAENKDNKRRLRYFSKVLKQAESVRVNTESLKTELLRRFKKIPDIALLPRFYNAHHLLKLPLEPEKDNFSQFSFTMLYIGELGVESTLYRAIDAVRAILQTPSIGFVVMGEGARREQFKERAKMLGIGQQVLFLNKSNDIIPFLQSTDVLIVTDTSAESEELVIKAAAAGTPMVMAKTQLRTDLFTDGLDTFLCEPEDTLGFHKRIMQFLNTNALRTQFANNGREVIRTRIEEDPQIFRLAYRDSIEKVLYFEEAEVKKEEAKVAAKNNPVPEKPKTIIVDGMEMRVPAGQG